MNSMSLREEEGEVLDQIAKANKDSIAQYWERCPSGFMCKICNMHYKVLKNVRYLSKFTCIFIHTNARFANTESSRGENEMNFFFTPQEGKSVQV